MRRSREGQPGDTSNAAFFERSWIPWWIPGAIFAGLFFFIFGLVRIITVVHGAKPPMDSVFLQAVPGAGTGLLMAVVVWISAGPLRTITVDTTAIVFSLGFGSTELASVKAVAVVRGDEMRKIRKDLSAALEPEGSLGSLLRVAASPALATASYSYNSIPRSRAVLAPFYIHEAVAVFAPGALTPLRLIGTRRPEELAAAIRWGAGLPDSDR